MTATTSIPRALALIADDPNLAVDAALAAALPVMNAAAQDEALRVLGRRGDVSTLAGIVANFTHADHADRPELRGAGSQSSADLRSLLIRHVSDLHSGLRAAVESHEQSARLAAIGLIVAADDARSAYMLAGALRSACHQTRDAAASALRNLAANALDGGDAGSARLPASVEAPGDGTESGVAPASGRYEHGLRTRATLPTEIAQMTDEVAARRRALTDALAHAVRGWEVHHQTPALEAALWFSAELEPVVLEKLDEPRSRIGHALQEILETATDGRLAGFVLRALAIPWLRPAAAKAIGRARNSAFLRSLAKESDLLNNPKVSAGCHWVHDCAWARPDGQWPKGIPAADAARLVRLFARTGVAADRKMSALRAWVRSSEASVRDAALEVLIADPSDAATRSLTEIGARAAGQTSDRARNEIRRRRHSAAAGGAARMTRLAPASRASAMQTSADTTVAHGVAEASAPQEWSSDDAFGQFFDEFDSLAPGERRLRADLFRGLDGALDARVLVKLRAKLASGVSLDRALALRVAREVGATHDLAERIFPLAYDADPLVRSLAVAMLAEIPGATSERILRRAADDTDPRVQANAIEASDRLDVEDRARWTEPKLDSRNNRVRANAVCSLLRLDLRRAAETLLDMLADPASEHRMSALWVIEHLQLRSAMHRVLQMSQEDADERIRKRADRLMRSLAKHAGGSFAHGDSASAAPASREMDK